MQIFVFLEGRLDWIMIQIKRTNVNTILERLG